MPPNCALHQVVGVLLDWWTSECGHQCAALAHECQRSPTHVSSEVSKCKISTYNPKFTLKRHAFLNPIRHLTKGFLMCILQCHVRP